MLASRRILCPTDFSEPSRGALEQAIVLARRHDSEIVCACVVPPLMPPATALALVPPPELDASSRQAVSEKLGRFAEPAVAAGLPTRLEVLEGSVASSLVGLASSLRADMIVMGTHGRSGVDRLLLGSVTEKVLHRAACPVLTVPRGARQDGRTLHAAFKSILCPLDFADASRAALRLAISLARADSARLLLLHVLEDPADGGVRALSHWTVPEYRGLLAQELRRRLHHAVSAEDVSGCAVEELLAVGKPYVEILRLAAKRACDLVVMGSRGGGLEAALFGSTAERVVRGAACPVVTVRPGRRSLGLASGL